MVAGPDGGTIDDGTVTGRSLAVGSYRPGLDGLRGIAMLVMLGYHSQLPYTKGAFLGLSQFFTLSGFLITGILLESKDREGTIALRRFWGRRFRRLLPAALVGLAGVIIYGATVATQDQAERLPREITTAATYVANWNFIATDQSYVDLFSAPSPVQHYWSLAVEEQFYILLPLALLVIFRFSRSPRVLLAVLGAAMVASSAWMAFLYDSGRGLDRIYYGTDTRMGEILAGCLLAAVLFHVPRISHRALTWMGAAGVIAYVATMWATVTVPLTDGLIWRLGMLPFALLSCTVVLGIVSGRGPLSTAFSWGPLPSLGRLIYGLYVYHWPIYLWLTEDRTGLSSWSLFGLRLAVTFAVAIPSYHLLEKPIRAGQPVMGRHPRWALVAPLTILAIIASAFVLHDPNADDPFETLRGDGSDRPPSATTDGVLDLLLITDVANGPVADEVESLAAEDPTVEVVRAEPFDCAALEGDLGERVCAGWREEWSRLITDHDPDVIVLNVDQWAGEDLTDLGTPEDTPSELAKEVLGSGIDILVAQGAPVLWAPSGATYQESFERSAQPLNQAMTWFDDYREDVEVILDWRRPVRSTTTEEDFIERSALTIIEDAALHQRQVDDRPRVLIVGDSQARSLGWGLQRWSVDTGSAVVWNVAVQGCGLADEGTLDNLEVAPVEQRCVDAIARLPSQVQEFDPDVVVVMSTIMDMIDRAHPSWAGFRSIEDPVVVEYLHSEYQETLDVLTSRGASVVWMNAPCTQFVPPPGVEFEAPSFLDYERSLLFNEQVLAPFAAQNSEVTELFDLDAVLCPDGRYRRDIDGVENVRVDGIHFSPAGALWFAEVYGRHIVELAR